MWFCRQIECAIGVIFAALPILALLLLPILPLLPDPENAPSSGLFGFAPGVDDLVGGVDVLPVDQSMHWRIVELDVELGSLNVFVRILDSCDGDDDYQGDSVQAGVDTAENGEKLRRSMS